MLMHCLLILIIECYMYLSRCRLVVSNSVLKLQALSVMADGASSTASVEESPPPAEEDLTEVLSSLTLLQTFQRLLFAELMPADHATCKRKSATREQGAASSRRRLSNHSCE